jgi:hypothetical protein
MKMDAALTHKSGVHTPGRGKYELSQRFAAGLSISGRSIRGSPGLLQTSACMPAAKRVFPDARAGFPDAMAGFEIDLE